MEKNLTTGSVFGNIVRFSLPYLFSYFLQTLYGMADLFIIGQYADASGTTAVSVGSQVMHMLTLMIVGLAMGATVTIGQAVGARDQKSAARYTGNTMTLFLVLSVAVTGLLLALARPIAAVMSTPAEAVSGTVAYLRICFLGVPLITAYNIIASVFRGLGDSKRPMYFIAVACAVNIALDYLFIGALHMGPAGAALGTTLAQAVSVAVSLAVMRGARGGIALTRDDFRPQRAIMGRILRIGVPIALQDVLVGVSFLVILAIVNSLGLLQSAGMGIAEKVCAFVMLLPSAFSQSVSAFVAQNTGAAKPDRAKKALRYSVVTSLCISVFVFYFNFFHGDLLAGIFANDRAVILEAADYLKAYAIDCLLTSFLFCFVGYFSGLGKTVFVMAQGILGAFGVRIPVSFFMSRLPNVRLFYIGLATPCSTVVQVLLCLAYYTHLSRREKAGPAV